MCIDTHEGLRFLIACAAIALLILTASGFEVLADDPAAGPDVPWTFERPRDELYVKSFNVESLSAMPDGSLAISGRMEPTWHTYLQLVAPSGETRWTRRFASGDGGPGVAFAIPMPPLSREPTVERLAVFGLSGELWWLDRSTGSLLAPEFRLAENEGLTLSAFAATSDTGLVVGGWTAESNLLCGDGAYVTRLDETGKPRWQWNDPEHHWSFARSVAALPNGIVAVQIADEPPPNFEPMGLWATEECPNWRGTEVVLLDSDGRELSRVALPGVPAGGAMTAVADDALALLLYDQERAASLLAVVTIRPDVSHWMDVRVHDLKEVLGDSGVFGETQIVPLDADSVAVRLADSWLVAIGLDGQVRRLEGLGSHSYEARCVLALDGREVACADTARITRRGLGE